MNTNELGSYRISDVICEEELINEIASILNMEPKKIEKIIRKNHGLTYVKNAFKNWPENTDYINSQARKEDKNNWTFLEKSGVKEAITKVSENFKNSKAIWLTYSFSCEDEIIKEFKQKNIDLSVVCCSPKEASISIEEFKKWKETGFELYYLASEGKSEFGRLHGKALVFNNSKNAIGLIGSFNLVHNSLYKNTESITLVEGNDAFQLWQEASFFLKKATIFTENLCKEKFSIIKSSPGTEIIIEIKRDDPIFYQEKIIRALVDWLNVKDIDEENLLKGKIVQLPTGTGKTLIAVEVMMQWLLKNMNSKILWIAPRGELLEQAIERLLKQYSNIANENISIWARHGQVSNNQVFKFADNIDDANIIFTTIRSAAKDIDSIDNIDLMIVDECHRYKSDVDAANKLHEIVCYSKKIGFSATPLLKNRSFLEYWMSDEDDLNNDLNGDFCKIIDLEDGGTTYEELESQDYLSERIMIYVDTGRISLPTVKRYPSDYEEWDSKVRDFWNKTVEAEVFNVIKSAEQGIDLKSGKKLQSGPLKRIMIFVAGRETAKDLTKKILKKGYRCFEHHSYVNTQERKYSLNEFKANDNEFKVMVSVQTGAEGIDVPSIDGLILSRPTFSDTLFQQMIGRGLRGTKMNGTKFCYVWDFTYTLVDSNGQVITNTRSAREIDKRPNQKIFYDISKNEQLLINELPENFHARSLRQLNLNLTMKQRQEVAQSLQEKGLIEFKARGRGFIVRRLNSIAIKSSDKPKTTKITQDEIDYIGNLTVKSAIDQNMAEKISLIIGVPPMKVQSELENIKHKQGKVQYMIDAWDWPFPE